MFGANLEKLTELGQQEIEVGSSLTPMSDQDIIFHLTTSIHYHTNK